MRHRAKRELKIKFEEFFEGHFVFAFSCNNFCFIITKLFLLSDTFLQIESFYLFFLNLIGENAAVVVFIYFIKNIMNYDA